MEKSPHLLTLASLGVIVVLALQAYFAVRPLYKNAVVYGKPEIIRPLEWAVGITPLLSILALIVLLLFFRGFLARHAMLILLGTVALNFAVPIVKALWFFRTIKGGGLGST